MNYFLVVCILIAKSVATIADVSHLFSPDYSFFQQFVPSYQHPFQFVQRPPHHQQPQHDLQGLYAPPSQQTDDHINGGYPNPSPPTPAPVAPTSSTTEFFLPEIIENRRAKDHGNFIPLHQQYLPPEDRPTFENPKPPIIGDQNHHHHQQHYPGYHYQRPTTTTTSSTTTEHPRPIVVVDPIEFIPPLNDNPPSIRPPSNGFHGYDYHVPAPVAPTQPPLPPSPTLPPIIILPQKPSTPAPVYLPASNIFSNDDLSPTIYEQSDANLALRLQIKEMRCLHNSGGYFRSILKVDSFLSATPTVDNDSNDKRCELRLSKSFVIVDIAAEDFEKCGVRECNKDLCLRLRFPSIRGMRTGSDAILTLHCKTQERVAVKTHALKMGVANDVQARSIGTYAHGGSQNLFRTHVELLRKTKSGYSKHLDANAAVQIGEELLLRAHVLPGDGWNFTKLSDVSLQRISPTGELLNVAHLITPRGCINPSMQSICPQTPIFDPPLGHKLSFKAVMFQGMHSGDELVLSMRITGCLEHQDCYFNQQDCTLRRRRNADTPQNHPVNGSEKHEQISEISRISFKVVMNENSREAQKHPPMEITSSEEFRDTESNDNRISDMTIQPHTLILACSVGFVLMLSLLGVIIAWKFRDE